MDYLQGAPQQIFAPLVTDILDEKPKDIHTWMLNYIRKNKVKLRKACINVPQVDPDTDTEDEEDREERLANKRAQMGSHEILEESENESFGQGDPDPEPDF